MRDWIRSLPVRIRLALGLKLTMVPADVSKSTALLVFMSSRAISSSGFSAPSEVILTRDNIAEWCTPTDDTLKDAVGDVPSAEQMWSTLGEFIGGRRGGLKWNYHCQSPRCSLTVQIHQKRDVFVVTFSSKADGIFQRIGRGLGIAS